MNPGWFQRRKAPVWHLARGNSTTPRIPPTDGAERSEGSTITVPSGLGYTISDWPTPGLRNRCSIHWPGTHFPELPLILSLGGHSDKSSGRLSVRGTRTATAEPLHHQSGGGPNLPHEAPAWTSSDRLRDNWLSPPVKLESIPHAIPVHGGRAQAERTTAHRRDQRGRGKSGSRTSTHDVESKVRGSMSPTRNAVGHRASDPQTELPDAAWPLCCRISSTACRTLVRSIVVECAAPLAVARPGYHPRGGFRPRPQDQNQSTDVMHHLGSGKRSPVGGMIHALSGGSVSSSTGAAPAQAGESDSRPRATAGTASGPD